MVEFNAKEQIVYGSYENRVTLNWVSAELSISQLTYEDSGHYELEVYMNNQLHRSDYRLEVIGKFLTLFIFK